MFSQAHNSDGLLLEDPSKPCSCQTKLLLTHHNRQKIVLLLDGK